MWWQILMLGMAMGMNNALASVALGAMRMRRRDQLRIALVFGVFEALMPIAGVVIGEQVSRLAGNQARWIGIAVLAAFGIYSLLKREEGEDAHARTEVRGMRVVMLAAALSLDNLTIGFGLGMLRVPLALAAALFGMISLAMAYAGLEVGRWLGTAVNISADKLAGLVLLLTAGLMLWH